MWFSSFISFHIKTFIHVLTPQGLLSKRPAFDYSNAATLTQSPAQLNYNVVAGQSPGAIFNLALTNRNWRTLLLHILGSTEAWIDTSGLAIIGAVSLYTHLSLRVLLGQGNSDLGQSKPAVKKESHKRTDRHTY